MRSVSKRLQMSATSMQTDIGSRHLSSSTTMLTQRCCAGFRVGWAALPPPLARKLEKALFASCLGPTPFSQVRSAVKNLPTSAQSKCQGRKFDWQLQRATFLPVGLWRVRVPARRSSCRSCCSTGALQGWRRTCGGRSRSTGAGPRRCTRRPPRCVTSAGGGPRRPCGCSRNCTGVRPLHASMMSKYSPAPAVPHG